MAEVMMKKLTLAGVVAEKEEVLKQLAFCGAVEVKDASFLLDDEEALPGAKMDAGNTYELRGDLEKLQNAIAILDPFAPKRGMLTPKPSITRMEMEDALTNREAVMSTVDEVLRTQRLRASLAPDRAKMEGQILSLQPWVSVDIPLSVTETKLVSLVYGTFPAAADLVALEDLIAEKKLDCTLLLIEADVHAKYVLAFYYKGSEDEVLQELRENSFSKLTFREFSGTPSEEIRRLEKEIEENLAAFDRLGEQLAAMSGEAASMHELLDTLNGWLTMAESRTKLMVTEHSFFLNGFVPETRVEELEHKLHPFCVAYELSEVDIEEDDPPVLLKNNALVEPYEMVSELYSLPAYGAFDPNPIMAPFFFVFFGMMLGDAGYGILMILAGLVGLRSKPEGFLKRILMLCIHGGIASSIWGFITGTFFGDALYVISSNFTNHILQFKVYIDPMANPLPMLAFCCGLGALHLLSGMAIQFYMCLKRKDYVGAFIDIGLWWVVFAGIAVLALGMGPYVLLAGTVGLILTQGRAKNGIISKLFSGILSLYNITGYLGDVLSYSRLMALGMASAVISQVFNQIATMAGNGIIGMIFFAAVFLAGHGINLFINVLGAYVHSSRLQYVEFFGKFFESGGRPFSPLKITPKYYKLNTEEEKVS